MSESLEKCGGASFRYTSCAMDDEVLNEPALVVAACLERQNDPRVISNVADFSALGEVSSYDLVAIQPDPDNRHLRAPIRFKRDQVRQG
jgi:hypothetical protein